MASLPWKTRPVFISSTFVDMQAERDHLRNEVFPVLEERLRQRRHHLEWVDLRWGVETREIDESHKKEMLVLKVCLNEIERSRPFLIAMIGDRYGWVPPGERMDAATKEAGFETDVEGKSVTALEIEYGVLDSSDQRQRSFFYFREPLSLVNEEGQKMPPEQQVLFSEEWAGNIGNAQRLEALKDRIKQELPDRWRPYQARWKCDENGEVKVIGLEKWGQMVLEDLWVELEKETKDYSLQEPPSWVEQERRILEVFIEDRGRGFIGRKSIVQRLFDHASSPVVDKTATQGKTIPRGLCITGKSGTGKSALFAHIIRRLQDRDAIVLSHAAGISSLAVQIDSMLERWTEELAGATGVKNPLSEKVSEETISGDKVSDWRSSEEIEKAFLSLLRKASSRQRVILLIDALNQFERSPRAKQVTWLPDELHENVRLIVTSTPGTESESIVQRPGIELLALPPLDREDAAEIVRGICSRYHRTLNKDVLEILLDKRMDDNSLSAGNPLWLELAVERLNLLDADDFARARHNYTGTDEERLIAMISDTAREFPPDVEGMYGNMFDHAENLYGRAWTQAFLNLIAVSRNGWRERDLGVLMPRVASWLDSGNAVNDYEWDPLRFASLRRAFRSHVIQAGVHDQWKFSHIQMREAVKNRNLGDENNVKRLHAHIADYLGDLNNDDPFRLEGYMHHLIGADKIERSANYYAMLKAGDECDAASRALARHILDKRSNRDDSGFDLVFSFFEQDLNNEMMTRIQQGLNASKFILHLVKAFEKEGASTDDCIEFMRRLEDNVSHFADIDPEIARLQFEQGDDPPERINGLVSAIYSEYLKKAGRFTESVEKIGRAEEIFRELYNRQSNQRRLSDLENVLKDHASLLEQLGRPDRAKSLRNEAIFLRRMLSDDLAVEDAHEIEEKPEAVSMVIRGQDLVNAGRYKEAINYFEKSLPELESIYHSAPDWENGRLLVHALGRYGDALSQVDREKDAASIIEKAASVAKKVYRLNPIPDTAKDYLTSEDRVIRHLAGQGLHREAVEHAESVTPIAEKIFSENPNVDTLRILAVFHNLWGNSLVEIDQVKHGLEQLQKSIDLFEKNFMENPSGRSAEDYAVSLYQKVRHLPSEQERKSVIRQVCGVAQWMTSRNLQVPNELLLISAFSTLMEDAPPNERESRKGAPVLENADQNWQEIISSEDIEEAEIAGEYIPILERRQKRNPSQETAKRLLSCYKKVLAFDNYGKPLTEDDLKEHRIIACRGLKIIDWISSEEKSLDKNMQKLKSLFEFMCPNPEEFVQQTQIENDNVVEPDIDDVMNEYVYISREITSSEKNNVKLWLSEAGALYDQKDFGESEKLYRKILVFLDECLGQFSPATAITLIKIGDILTEKKDINAAIRLYENALISWQEHEGGDNSWTKLFRVRFEDLL